MYEYIQVFDSMFMRIYECIHTKGHEQMSAYIPMPERIYGEYVLKGHEYMSVYKLKGTNI